MPSGRRSAAVRRVPLWGLGRRGEAGARPERRGRRDKQVNTQLSVSSESREVTSLAFPMPQKLWIHVRNAFVVRSVPAAAG